MYKVLVPLDGSSERERTQVSTLIDLPVDKDEVEVVLTHVLTDDEERAPKEMQRPERISLVKDARERLDDAGFSVTVRSAHSPPEEGIIDLAERADVDHIVLGGRKRSPAGKALFGSVTQNVILNTELPVTVTGGSADSQ
jgi:nucleotide-binding universal stress UspA family protein